MLSPQHTTLRILRAGLFCQSENPSSKPVFDQCGMSRIADSFHWSMHNGIVEEKETRDHQFRSVIFQRRGT